jgi:16S rRNA (cytidine1402-2'-O)-methyltransferase
MEAGSLTSGLVLCATPIGNLEDITLRALTTLATADIVACEDTRRTGRLLSHHGIKAKKLVSYHDGNEAERATYLVDRISRGDLVALVSDAGTPGLSDPGYRLVRACIEAELAVAALPGPAAAIVAVTMSGLPCDRFIFEGFLPRKKAERRRRLQALVAEERTLVFYESPHRLVASLGDCAELLGDRQAAVARELTKLHEEVKRGSLEELASWAADNGPRGEMVVIVAGAATDAAAEIDPGRLAAEARALMADGVERRAAMGQVARSNGVRRTDVFDALVQVENDEGLD